MVNQQRHWLLTLIWFVLASMLADRWEMKFAVFVDQLVRSGIERTNRWKMSNVALASNLLNALN